MAWYADLTPCDYFGKEHAKFLHAVGWLERGQVFSAGPIEEKVFTRLVELLNDPWQPCLFRGLHDCDLCQFESKQRGFKNLFIPGKSMVYVCPELILHYISAHWYVPPAAFCQAVMDCPSMLSIQYLNALLNCGAGELVKKKPMN